ncbi:spermidine/putrescine ABC transporter substrate-binding protein [Vibrio sp. JC009]|uniref:ABC transporter substrate-binding protein n=1 Tax=Vibrio sp. JC009 TaxID=2912314 RepID=UPI0023B00822|nr:spermidine/putrescine ABC transporter substrate-binding protein [Vibrio sp. JC009]WED24920.1 spermidine/putrescine ABC transporter substrate-binding protein [Vibrio sp. JC009]
MKTGTLHRVVLSILLGLFCQEVSAHHPNRLVILNWADYLDPAIVADFEKEYQAEISEILYESDEERTNMLVANSAEGYDLILCAGIDLATYARNGFIIPLDFAQIPNSQFISPRWKSAFEQSLSYGLPYFWGTIGVIYRSDLIQPKAQSWQLLFTPPDKLKGRIGMMTDGRDLISMALKALGYSVNSVLPGELSQVEKLLVSQKPFVRSYQYVNLDEDSELISGDIWASMMYNGDALMVMEHSDDLKFYVPDEGTNLWVDYFSVGAKAHNPELAYAFLNYINSPEIAARQALYTYYASPNNAAIKLLPEEVLSNPVIYPSKEVISRSEFYHPLPSRQYLRRQKLSAKVLSD